MISQDGTIASRFQPTHECNASGKSLHAEEYVPGNATAESSMAIYSKISSQTVENSHELVRLPWNRARSLPIWVRTLETTGHDREAA